MTASEAKEWGPVVLVGAFALGLWDRLFGTSASEEGLEDLHGAVPSGQVPTFPLGSFVIWADELEQALMGGMGEDEETVFRVFNLQCNEADVEALVRQFGVRTPWNNPFASGTLPQAIIYYLDPEEVAMINDILRHNGVQFSFGDGI